MFYACKMARHASVTKIECIREIVILETLKHTFIRQFLILKFFERGLPFFRQASCHEKAFKAL